MPTYSWLTKTAAVSALQGRLNSTTFWSAAECWVYLSEALRIWSSLTECWKTDFVTSNSNGAWINTGTLAGSPRLRTQTDQTLYAQMLYMLLEPQLTGGVTWTGTNQFNLANLQFCLQKRTQEVIQATACNLAQLPLLNATPGTRRNVLPDSVLEQRRTRFLAVMAVTTGSASSGALMVAVASALGIANGQVLTGTGIQPGTFVTGISGNSVQISLPTTSALISAALQFAQPVTLTREDTQAFQFFEPGYLQDFGMPQSWSVASEPPLAFDTDLAPDTAGAFDILALNAAATFAPPAATLLGIPDHWSWLPMYGALADVLGIESEATDRQRAAYCLERYTQGLEIMKQSNWLAQAAINGVAVDPDALAEIDQYAPEWQASNQNLPAVVQAGIDLLAPTPGLGQSVSLTLVGNAPLLDTGGTLVQVARDDFEAVLNYSQHLASFKQGGEEFAATLPLLKDFFRAAGERNKRWMHYGIFTEILNSEGKRQETVEAR
jgi:hypothetical protein